MSVEDLFSKPLKVINVGLRSFAQDLRSVGVECQQVSVDPVESGRPRAGDDGLSEASLTRTSAERE